MKSKTSLNTNSRENCDKYLRKAIDAVSSTAIPNSDLVDGPLTELRISYLKSNDLPQAVSLYEHAVAKLGNRVDDAESRESASENATMELKISFAELLLLQVAESNTEESRDQRNKARDLISITLGQNKSLKNYQNLVKRTNLRQTIAEKYPALFRLDIICGAIVFQEGKVDLDTFDPAAVILDGRRVCVTGNYNTEIVGTGDGTLSILLDGKTFVDRALSAEDSDELTEAEKLFVVALRAEPSSKNFSMLSEFWFLQRKFDESRQAASMAVECDSRNYEAIALRTLSGPKLGQSADKSNDDIERLKFAVTDESHIEDPFVIALCNLALGKNKLAKKQFQQIAKSNPSSYRVKEFTKLASKPQLQ